MSDPEDTAALPAIALVVAMDRRGAIGRDGDLPWHLPDDLKHFKQLTLGHPLLMGRRTFESIGRPLPQRRNLVLTRNEDWQVAGTERVASLDQALQISRGAPWLMVIGGGELYGLALPRAQRIHLCAVDAEIADADTWFPAFDRSQWREMARREHPADERHQYAFAQLLLERLN